MANESAYEAMIENYGWAACATVTESGTPFTYSIGFNTVYDAPDIIVVGVSPQMAHGCIVNAAELLLLDGATPFKHGDTSKKIIEDKGGLDFKVKFVECSDFIKKNFMCQAGFHYGEGKEFSVLQMLWPDIDGHLPDELEYECISQMLCERDL